MARTPLLKMLRKAAQACARDQEPYPDPPRLGRRTLLAGAAGLALAPLRPATGLTATARIAVVGAGLAGLTAAYQLRKAGYGCDLFEGSTRLGGRCYSARGVFAEGQVAEHGGEFIDTSHTEIRALAEELGLTLDDVLLATPPGTRAQFRFDGRPYSLADATRDWQAVYPVIQAQATSLGDYDYRAATPQARQLDSLTIADWVEAHVPGGRDGQLGQLIETAFAEENAADADQQSALNAIEVLAVNPRDAFNLYNTESDQRFHVHGGNDQIATRMGEAAAARLRTGTALLAVARTSDGRVRLTLKRDTAVTDAVYDRVILALPFAVLRSRVDISRAGFRALKREAIETLPIGASVKFQLQFDRRVWTAQGGSGEMRVDSPYFQTTWEVTRGQPGTAGILNFFSGGTRAFNAGNTDKTTLAAAVMQDASAILPNLPTLWNGRMIRDAWADNPWSLGSYSYYPPNYLTRIAGIEAEPEGNCHFAGEHTATENGYMNAAVQTGARAAAAVAASLGQGRK